MQTETLFLPKKSSSEEALSPALLSATSHRCWIATEHGGNVRLTLAGYVLHFWRSYRVCFSEPVKELRLAAYPNHFIKKQLDRAGASSKHGEPFKFIPIRASYRHWLEPLTHQGNYPHELELEVVFADDRRTTVNMPIVLQMSFPLRMLLILAVSLVWVPFGIAREAFAGWDLTSFLSWKSWGFGVASALVYVLWYLGLCLWSLRTRALELGNQFQRRWTAAPTTKNV